MKALKAFLAVMILWCLAWFIRSVVIADVEKAIINVLCLGVNVFNFYTIEESES